MAILHKKTCRGHTYWQIVESRRINGKPRPIVLMHLGTADTLLRRLQESPLKPKTAKILEFGALAALWNIAEELRVVETIDKHAPKREQGLSCAQYMLLAALNRCVHASSKSSLYDWYRKTVLRRLLPASKRALTSQRFWDHMSFLNEDIIIKIEEDFARHLVDHFNIDLHTLLFDATNFDTYIDTQTVCSLAQRGHAKSKRKDLRIIGLALMVSKDFNVPLFSHPYPGNQNDSKTFKSAIKSLIDRYCVFAQQCQDITIIYDGGNNSNENAELVDRSKYHFVTSLTITHHNDLLSIPLRCYKPLKGARLKDVLTYRTSKVIWGNQRTVVVTRSPQLLAGQLAGITSALRKKRAKLYELRSKLLHSQKPHARGKGYTYQSLQKQLDTIVSGQYTGDILKVKVIQSKKKLDFTFYTDQTAFNKLKQYRLGKRILCTDNHNWTSEEIVLASRSQFHVENAFKQMKNPHWVSFSPTFHWTDQKLRVHAFYCVLALTMSALLQRKAAQAGIDITIPELLKNLSEVHEVLNLYAPETRSGRGRFRAEIVLSERSYLQERLCRIFDTYKHCRS